MLRKIKVVEKTNIPIGIIKDNAYVFGECLFTNKNSVSKTFPNYFRKAYITP